MIAYIDPQIFEVVVRSFSFAGLTVVCLFVPGILVAYFLARKQFWGKNFVSALISLPLVLPPTAVGYLMLQLLGVNGVLGEASAHLNILFTWKAVVIACAIMSLPLFVRTARISFESSKPEYESIARSLGKNSLQTFFQVTLPITYRGIISASVLAFVRSIGEFGATIIIAGNIPGKTQTLSTAIYSAQQSGDASLAQTLLIIALILGFIAVYFSESFEVNPKHHSKAES